MSRSDLTYPHYRKLDLSKEKPPRGWDDGVRRCIQCKKNWPNLPEFSPSPCCDAQAGIVADDIPDMSWGFAYKALMTFRFEKYYEKWNEGVSDLELSWTNFDPVSDDVMSEGMKEVNSLIASVEERVNDGSEA